ncbi:hypothetical protein P280DRAFT_518246 [Massarina eburnea CBS 473.64]|uniref:Nephrocystin 3-like N-terminal domain-containing protein n=1 Tax=Massarina eburnea CBS 473.64 TaxID=1395130 RepID=A0A6A6S423_9PLEO|nr:hypothetical protein P280DRAFT_518246 [Massarina eburnea CBS 473.64]
MAWILLAVLSYIDLKGKLPNGNNATRNEAVNAIQINAPVRVFANYANDPNEQAFLRSLEPCDFELVQYERRKTIAAETYQWFLREKQFQRWNTGNKVLWISGKPGSGKRFIANYLCEHLEQQKHILMQFVFDSKSAEPEDLQSLNNFYQTLLLRQIPQLDAEMRARYFKKVREKVKQEHPNDDPLKEEDLKE